MKRILGVIVLTILLYPAKAQTWPDTVQLINNMFGRYLPGNPGGQLSISRNGKLVFSKAWGLADIENKVPYTTETVTEAGLFQSSLQRPLFYCWNSRANFH